MIHFLDLLHQNPVVQALGFALLHSLWQGIVVAAFLWLIVRFIPSYSAHQRYVLACLSLLLLVMAFAYTVLQQYQALEALRHVVPAAATIRIDALPTNTAIPQTTLLEQCALWYKQFVKWFSTYSHYVFVLWAIGFAVFAFRFSLGFLYTENITRQAKPLPDAWTQKLTALKNRIGMNSQVRLLSSRKVNVPCTFGWLKPVIIFPVSLLTQLPTEQLDSILLHELAHIKRQDYLVNLLQSFAEIAFFFNPGFWYISSILEKERENASDDLVVSTLADRVTYARALTNLAALCQPGKLQPAVIGAAGKKQTLLFRIQRIIHPTEKNTSMKKSFKSRYHQLAILCMAFILLAFITIDVKGDKGISNSYINEATDNSSYSIISGKVFSMATGEVLPGMAIRVKEHPKATTTDENGNFKIAVPQDAESLVFSLNGYEKKEVHLEGQENINIGFKKASAEEIQFGEPTTIQLDEFPQLKPEQVTSDTSIVPLYIVDGKELNSIEDISPDAIATMNVFKGQLAKDRYGEKGENGVIEIATKQMTKPDPRSKFEAISDDNATYILNGKEVTKQQAHAINPKDIKTVNIRNFLNAESGKEEKIIDINTESDDSKKTKLNPNDVLNAKKDSSHIEIMIKDNPVSKIDEKGNATLTGNDFQIKFRESNPDNQIKPIYIIDGKLIDKQEVEQLDPNSIEKIEVLKDKSAMATYGEKAKDGAIIITSKQVDEGTNGERKEFVEVLDQAEPKEETIKVSPEEELTKKDKRLYIVDGKEIDRSEINDYHNITMIQGVGGSPEIIKKYGPKAKNGVVLITTSSEKIPLIIRPEDNLEEELSIFPNPSQNEFTINLNLEKKAPVSVKVLDKNGKVVSEILNKTLEKGPHQTSWNAAGLEPGLYTVSIIQGDKNLSRNIILK